MKGGGEDEQDFVLERFNHYNTTVIIRGAARRRTGTTFFLFQSGKLRASASVSLNLCALNRKSRRYSSSP